ncbi:hypothetical protein LPJ61_003364, partial [Coemansia biformis]
MADPAASQYAKTAELIREAVAADSQGRYAEALGQYNNALKSIAELQRECTGGQRAALDAKYCEYVVRASQLLRQLAENPAHHGDLDKASAALQEARCQHGSGNIGAALSLYASGIGRYQAILRLERAAAAPSSTSAGRHWSRELHKFATICLKEAERAKSSSAAPEDPEPAGQAVSPLLTVSDHGLRSRVQHKLSELSLGTASAPASGDQL